MIPAYQGAEGALFNAYDLGIHLRDLVHEVKKGNGEPGKAPRGRKNYHNAQTTTRGTACRNGVCAGCREPPYALAPVFINLFKIKNVTYVCEEGHYRRGAPCP